MSNEGGHSVLDVQKVRLDVGVEEPLEKGTVEEGDVTVGAEASGRELEGVTDEEDFLYAGLEGDEEVGLGGLCCLVDNQTSELTPHLVQLLSA